MIRLNRFLALAGIASRRACDELIRSGRVAIDGSVVTAPGFQVDENVHSVIFDRREVKLDNRQTYLCNKPAGVLSTVRDPHGGTTILDLARAAGIPGRIYPVGRLDRNSRGLILLTDDGELANRLIHPRYHIEKEYHVSVDVPLNQSEALQFTRGLQLEDGITAPCRISPLQDRLHYRVILIEGRKRQIRRMFEALDKRVGDLVRVRIGPLLLHELSEGQIRGASDKEIVCLREAVRL